MFFQLGLKDSIRSSGAVVILCRQVVSKTTQLPNKENDIGKRHQHCPNLRGSQKSGTNEAYAEKQTEKNVIVVIFQLKFLKFKNRCNWVKYSNVFIGPCMSKSHIGQCMSRLLSLVPRASRYISGDFGLDNK